MRKAEASVVMLAEWRSNPFTRDVYAALRRHLKRLEAELVDGDGTQRSPQDEGIRTKELRAEREGLLHFLEERWVSDLPDQEDNNDEVEENEEIDPYES